MSRLSRKRRLALVALVAVAVALVVGKSAFTASNTVPNASLGQGSNTISGYTISSVAYNANGSDPTKIDSVSFTISPASAGTVEIQAVSGGSWYSCTNSSGSVSCATTSPQLTASAANSLNVVAGA